MNTTTVAANDQTEDEDQSDSDSSSCWYDYPESIPDNQNSESQDGVIYELEALDDHAQNDENQQSWEPGNNDVWYESLYEEQSHEDLESAFY